MSEAWAWVREMRWMRGKRDFLVLKMAIPLVKEDGVFPEEWVSVFI